MASQQENLTRLREAYRRWHRSKGTDVECWLDLMGAQVVYRAAPEGKIGLGFAAHSGAKEEIAALIASQSADWEMIFVKIDEYVAQTNRVVAIGSCAWRNRKTGKAAETPIAHFWRFKDGKVVEFMQFFDTAAVMDAART